MDTRAGAIMRILKTTGFGYFEEAEWDKPDITDGQIEVKAIMTGICRSDIDMMNGKFMQLPIEMQGHEGIGQVTKIAKDVIDVQIGDYVATRGEPAYSDFYNVDKNNYVKIPEAHPKYILEPIACGINIIMQPAKKHPEYFHTSDSVLIIGSGFLAWVAYNTLRRQHRNVEDIDIVGHYNLDLDWGRNLFNDIPNKKYDVIIDLSSRTDILELDIYKEGSLLIMGVQKKMSSDFGNLLWKSCVISFPSPRYSRFIQAMRMAGEYITHNKLNVDSFWTRGYNRDTEWKQAFNDASDRTIPNYNRGYLIW